MTRRWRVGRIGWPAVATCFGFTSGTHASSTSWVTDLPAGGDTDFMFAWVMSTVLPTTPTGWVYVNDSSAIGGFCFGWYRRKRQAGDTTLTVNFGSAASGAVIVFDGEIDQTFPGDSWNGAAYNGQSGDFAGVVEPWNFDTNYGPYNPDGTMFIAHMWYSGTKTSGPASPWVLGSTTTSGGSTHEAWYWLADSGNVPDFTWDTDGSTHAIDFIEVAYLCGG